MPNDSSIALTYVLTTSEHFGSVYIHLRKTFEEDLHDSLDGNVNTYFEIHRIKLF
jgi:hypothetical protein